MPEYMKKKEITWPVVFSKQDVYNPDYGVEGIPHLTIIAPNGKVSSNKLHPSDGQREVIEKIDGLLGEFGLRAPPQK